MLLSNALIAALRVVIGASARWESPPAFERQRIYYANHTSHMDTLAIMAALPRETRHNVKPVAARDYWGKNGFLSYVAEKGLGAVLIDRRPASAQNALEPIMDVVQEGHSIIIFPEGSRTCDALPGPFKSGLYRLAEEFPDVDLVPVYLDNLHRSMPKGKHIPLPILCGIRIGDPLVRKEGEGKQDFLDRAREAIVRLSL